MINEMETSIISKAIIRSGIHFYAYEDAQELINICEKSALPILGIDSLIVTTDITQPLIEHSIDFSGSQNSHDDARAFLDSRKYCGFVFEVVN